MLEAKDRETGDLRSSLRPQEFREARVDAWRLHFNGFPDGSSKRQHLPGGQPEWGWLIRFLIRFWKSRLHVSLLTLVQYLR
jgi:hypothetical protein